LKEIGTVSKSAPSGSEPKIESTSWSWVADVSLNKSGSLLLETRTPFFCERDAPGPEEDEASGLEVVAPFIVYAVEAIL
jgi:hypothetical protein